MPDREKVVKGLECCLSGGNADGCEPCPYKEECHETVGKGASPLQRDALELLKEQEPARAIREFSYGDKDGSWWYECGNCLNPIDFHDVFCSYCGKRLKWDVPTQD